ncbi:MAG: hypothetical protein FJ286_18545, partial [Planctomycetes bacterium]|nr:hypothetical protein [Planctomycetota bacterium]
MRTTRRRSPFALGHLLRSLFARPLRSGRRSRRASTRHRGGHGGWFTPAPPSADAGLCGFDALEQRALLAANDIDVGLADNRVLLALDPAGAAITDLTTAYSAASRTLTIRAVTTGSLSTSLPAGSGVTIDPGTDTITVDLRTLAGFAGISVVGSAAADSIQIGPGGVNLAAVTRGAANQGLSIDTGSGGTDSIVIASPVSAKGAGAVSLKTLGLPDIKIKTLNGAPQGILLTADVTSPKGLQTFAGPVTLGSDVALRSGGALAMLSTVDGPHRLTVSSGGAVTFAENVGAFLPLRGLTLAAAKSVAVQAGINLGTGPTVVVEAGPTDGLVIGKNVNGVVFAGTQPSTISGFSGAGILFAGGSRNSRIAGVTSIGNGTGLRVGPGTYTGTVITANTFVNNSG